MSLNKFPPWLRVIILAAGSAAPAHAQLVADNVNSAALLSRMSLEDLAKVEVTSVSKVAQPLSSAAASIYVITGEEIRRSGALSIPEALRLAPNLQVTQTGSQGYQIGARGFGGNLEVQNFSNKILILIDGRSVYNPLFSGVSYDAQDVSMDDVDRIEVISGPGATLWGANAMNGVINIITKSSHDTKGGLVHASAGGEDALVSARFGGGVGEEGAFRVYAKAFDRGPSESAGASAGDRWNKTQAGFRMDLGADADRFVVEGDYQRASESAGTFGDVHFSQGDMLGRWEHEGDRATTRLQLYVDHTRRDQPPSGVGFGLTTYDFDFQQTVNLGTRHDLVWGLGRRYNDYDITNTPTLAFDPPSRTPDLTNVFAQDTISFGDRWKFTAGLKFEENRYSGWTALPDLRLAWSPDDVSLVWISAARAIRAPTPFDVDVRETVGGMTFLEGNPDFRPESVDAYEIGYRSQPRASVSWSASLFYDDYKDLRTIEPTPQVFIPLWWGNRMHGTGYGVEIWGNWQVTEWWRLSPGFRTLTKRLHFDDDASGILGTQQAGNDAHSKGMLKSSMIFGRASFDATLRHVGELPSPHTPAYTELSARLGWRLSDSLDLALTGFNLLHGSHLEYAAPSGNEIRRSIYAEVRWSF